MAYDRVLADRIRELLAENRDVTPQNVTEQTMFGGLAFMLDGHMAVAASGHGGLMVRVDPDQSDRLMAGGAATIVEMGARTMPGWLLVPSDGLRTKRQLARWVRLGVERARSLPPRTRTLKRRI